MTTETVLTDEQIEHGRHNTFSTNNPFCPCDSKTMRKAARWAEQAVLQSPEIQALRKDAERIQFIADEGCVFNTWVQTDGTTKYRLEWDAGSSVSEWQDRWFDSPRESIDAAMEQQK